MNIKYTSIALLFLTTNILFAQNKLYKIPSRLDYTSKVYSDSIESMYYLGDGFLPIGFSKTDLMAYIIEPADEACGCYFLDICIKNMKTNKLLWKWEYRGEEADTTDGIIKQWNKNYFLISSQLRKFQIEQINNIALKKFPIFSNGNNYNIKLKTETFDSDYGSVIDNVKIIKQKNNKDVSIEYVQSHHTFSIDENKFGFTLSCSLNYYLENPFTKNVILIYSYEDRGYEGPPNVFRFEPLGIKLY